MRIAAVCLAALAAPAFAVDDPDLPVVSGRVPGSREAPGEFRLVLTRRVFAEPGDEGSDRIAGDMRIASGATFRFDGLIPGRYRLAFDEAGTHVLAEFDVADADLDTVFTYRAR